MIELDFPDLQYLISGLTKDVQILQKKVKKLEEESSTRKKVEIMTFLNESQIRELIGLVKKDDV